MNTRCIKGDLVEARDQLSALIANLDANEPITESNYMIELQHAFHHLNFAWNARHSSLEKYQGMSDADFNRWGKFPNGKEWKRFHRTTRSS
jgi:hypothetical protein